MANPNKVNIDNVDYSTDTNLTGKVCLTINVNTTDAGNVDGGSTNLMSYSIPGNSLLNTGDFIEVEAMFQMAVNLNNKTVTANFGGTQLYTSGSQTGSAGLHIKARIYRTGATTQKAECIAIAASTLYQDTAVYSTPGETLSGAVLIKFTGTGVSNNDIIQKMMVVKICRTP